MNRHQLICTLLIIFNLHVTHGQEEVTIEMFDALQAEINELYQQLNILQAEVQALVTRVQNLESVSGAVGNIELAELQALIEVSNKQEEDITKLFHTNGIWQQNFKVINNTFGRLRKVVVFGVPALNAPVVPMRVVRILPMINERNNVTVPRSRTLLLSTTAIPATSTIPPRPRPQRNG